MSEFVCDAQQAVDVSQMQDNIRSYKRLEEEANVLQVKIDQLEQIITEHTSFVRAKQDEQLYAYLLDRSQQDIKENALEEEHNNAEKLTIKLNDVEESIKSLSNRLSQMQDERNQLQARRINDVSLL
ncbi:MAG: hypothetical protein EOM30_08795 [Clostridia bacterium]|nr:hypothetical protein [Clostridia bacterium]